MILTHPRPECNIFTIEFSPVVRLVFVPDVILYNFYSRINPAIVQKVEPHFQTLQRVTAARLRKLSMQTNGQPNQRVCRKGL